MSTCVTEEVSLAPREITSRMNTFMLESRRQMRQGDKDSLVVHVVIDCVLLLKPKRLITFT